MTPPPHLTPFHRFVHQVATSSLGIWLFSNLLPHLDRLFFRLTRRKAILSQYLSGLPGLLLTTTGAHSGKPRTTPLLCFPDGQHPGRLALIASNWGKRRHPSWYYNLLKNPHAWGSLDGNTHEYIAHEAEGEEYQRLWQAAVTAYVGYQAYQHWAGWHIPIMVLVPEEGGEG